MIKWNRVVFPDANALRRRSNTMVNSLKFTSNKEILSKIVV